MMAFPQLTGRWPLVVVVCLYSGFAQAQNVPALPVRASLSTTNLLPVPQSPVEFFRRLLVMSAAERDQSLAGRTPESRDKIMAKVREYLALDPDERELRLQATELRWYLMPLLRTAPGDRDPNLTLVPARLRALVKSRLMQWDILPPRFQQEFLANDNTFHYFALATATVVTNAEQQQIVDRFNEFLALTPKEKQHVLETLSDAERGQMEKTLEEFKHLPPAQRRLCIHNFARFAGMSAGQRAEFLRNADSWSRMSPADRQAWRDLVDKVPAWPPLPTPAIMPTAAHLTTQTGQAAMATN
jgi:hypothetical protein